MFCQEDVVSVTSWGSHSQHLTVEIRKHDDDPWLFSVVYASPDSTLRKELWTELERIKDSYGRPWVVVGDFNETTSLQERHGSESSEMQRICRDFANWIENQGLIDLKFSGPEHTWFWGNSAETFKSTRLDRGLINVQWRLRFERARNGCFQKLNLTIVRY